MTLEEPLNPSTSSSNLNNDFALTISRRSLYNDSYGLPIGWNSFKDAHGRTYYVNFSSGVSQFENPLTNQIDRSQHTENSWSKNPPSIDACTPYYLWFLGNSIAHPDQYWYEEEESQPPRQSHSPTDPTTSTYWHAEGVKLYQQCNFVNQAQLDALAIRTPSSSLAYPEGIFQSLAWVFQAHTFLSLLTIVLLVTVTAWSYYVMKALKIDSWLPWTKYTSPIQCIIFLAAYALYAALFILPNLFCCLPWICGFNCGWANWCCCTLVPLDVVGSLKKRMLKESVKKEVVLDNIDQFQKDIPVLSIISETYHYPGEDYLYDHKNHNNASNYAEYSVQEAKHGALDSFQRRSSLSYHSGLGSVPNYHNSSNDPILSTRSRRLMDLERYRDLSVPSQALSGSLFADSHNLYDVVEVQYSSRFELHPVQVPLMDAMLREYYYHNYTNDLHCDVHLQYLLGPQSEILVNERKTDLVFTADQGGKQNGKCCFRFCFSCGGLVFWISLWLGLYIFALAIWKWSLVKFTYHNVKYLHLKPFELPDDHEEMSPENSIVVSPLATANASPISNTIRTSKATMEIKTNDPNSKRVQYKVFDQILFSGPRARTAGPRPDHHKI